MLARGTALAALAVALGGCTNDRFVTARMVGGNVEFVAQETSVDGACVSSLSIGRAREETLWAIEAVAADGTQVACAARMPVRYGVAPPGFRTLTPARPLIAGTTYDLTGSGGKFLRGAFRYDGPGRPVRNFEPNSAEWCEAQYPGTKPDWLGSCQFR